VDGIYDADPMEKPDAKFFPRISYMDFLKKDLKVMDSTAVTLCRDNKMPIIVLNLSKPGNIRKAVEGQGIGTLVS
jgi:uridylate kinase